MSLLPSLRALLLSAFLIVSFVVLPASVALSTTGLKLIAEWISTVRPELNLVIESGTLSDGRLETVTYVDDRNSLEIHGVAWQLAWSCLWNSTFCLDLVAIDELSLQLAGSDADMANSGVKLDLPFAVIADEIRIGKIVLERAGETQTAINDVNLAGNAHHSTVMLAALSARIQGAEIEANGVFELAPSFSSDVNVTVEYVDTNTRLYAANLSLQGDLDQMSVTGEITSPEKAQIAGAVYPLAAAVDLSLQRPGPWSDSDGEWSATDSVLGVTGSWPHLELTLMSTLTSPQLLAAELSLVGELTESQLELTSLSLTNEVLDWSGSGTLTQPSAPQFEFATTLKLSCSGLVSSPVDCDIAGPVKVTGHVREGVTDVSVQGNLTGEINETAAEVALAIDRGVDGELYLSVAEILVGDNSLLLSGVVGEKSDLHGDLNLVNLDQLLPGLGGRGEGHVILTGAVSAPVVKGTLELQSLRFGNLSLTNVSAGADWVGADNSGHFRLDSTDGNWSEIGLEHAQLTCDFTGGDVGIEQVDCADINFNILSDLESWQLSDTLIISRQDGDHISIEPFCLFSLSRSVCNTLPISWSQAEVQGVSLVGENFDLDWIKRWLPPDIGIDGAVGFTLHAGRETASGARAELVVSSPALQIGIQAAGKTINHPVSNLRSQAVVTEEDMSLNWSVEVGESGTSSGGVEIANWRDERRLQGEARFARVDVSPLLMAAPGVWEARGVFDGDISLTGSAAKPMMRGHLNLLEGYLDHANLPQPLDSFQLTVEFAGDQAKLSGGFAASAGEGRLDGQVSWLQDDWVAALRFEADEMVLEPLGGSQMHVSPAIDLELSPTRASVTGKVVVPYAQVVLDALPKTAVSVSQDTVIEGQYEESVNFDYQLDLDIELGEEVLLSAFGASSQLGGAVNIIGASGEDLHAFGTIDVLSGRYVAYGQKLEVTEGSFFFNGPVSRPTIRLAAVRPLEVSNVEVGVRVAGPATRPEITLFSQPAMNEDLIMYYLLTGTAPDADANLELAVAAAMMQLGLVGASNRLDKAVGKYGITDVQIGATQKEAGTQVDISAYISPQLYVRYGISTFDRVNTLRARYRVRNDLFIEALSGASNAIDILYAFDW